MRGYIVMTSSASMPSSCKGHYRNVAVVEVEDMAVHPAVISDRARGVIKIERHFGARNVGKTERGAYQRACAEADKLAKELNTGIAS